MIGTKLNDSTKLFFGLAELYLGDSATYEDSVVAALSDFGSLNGAFIVKKVSFLFPTVTNTVISNGQG